MSGRIARVSWSFLLLPACTPALEGDIADRLSRTGGCGDTLVYAVDADDTVELSVSMDGLIERAGGAPASSSFTLPDAAVVVQVAQGERVSSATCTDLIMNGGPDVVRTYTATAGTVDVTVRPGDSVSEADVVLSDVTLATDGEADITVGTFSWTAVHVGWYAG